MKRVPFAEQVLKNRDLVRHVMKYVQTDCAMLAGAKGEKCRYPFRYYNKDTKTSLSCASFCVQHLK